jgi:hypothetical protein
MTIYVEYKMFCQVVYKDMVDKRDKLSSMSFKQLKRYADDMMGLVSKASLCSKNRLKFRLQCVPEEARNSNHAYEIERANKFVAKAKDILRDINQEIHRRIQNQTVDSQAPFSVLTIEETPTVHIQTHIQNNSQTYVGLQTSSQSVPVRTQIQNVINSIRKKDEKFYYEMEDIFLDEFKKFSSSRLSTEQETRLVMVMLESYINHQLMMDIQFGKISSLHSLKDNLESDSNVIAKQSFTSVQNTVNVFKSVNTLSKYINLGKYTAYALKITLLSYFLEMEDDENIEKILKTPNEVIRQFETYPFNTSVLVHTQMFLRSLKAEIAGVHTYVIPDINAFKKGLHDVRSRLRQFFTPQTSQRHIDFCVYMCFKLGSYQLLDDPFSLPSTINISSFKLFLDKPLQLPQTTYMLRFIHQLVMYLTKEPAPSKFVDIFTFT